MANSGNKLTPSDIAERAVAFSLKRAGALVSVTDNPFTVRPDDLFDHTFEEVGIVDDAHVRTFAGTLVGILHDDFPSILDELQQRLEQLAVGVKIDLVSDFVAGLIDAAAESGN